MDAIKTGYQKKLEGFQCQQCNQCCRQPGVVYMTPAETETAASFLGITPFHFVNQYCELLDRRQIVLKKHEDEACIFLNRQGCSIHPAKPRQCREFPEIWRTPKSFDYCAGLAKLGLKPDSK